MCRRATGTPMLSATARCDSMVSEVSDVSDVSEVSDTEFLRIPLQPELARRRHVAHERRCGHHGRTREIAFSAEAHAVLPVAIERRNRALARMQGVRTLAET